jgi:hypothetical protein
LYLRIIIYVTVKVPQWYAVQVPIPSVTSGCRFLSASDTTMML